MSTQQSPFRQNSFELGTTPSGHEATPRFARMNEVALASLAAKEALLALHGMHVADAAGAAVATQEMQNPVAQEAGYLDYISRPDTQPEYAAASQPGFVPQSPEVQAYAAQQVAQQPVQVPASISAQTNGF
jgi:hypothetical protein